MTPETVDALLAMTLFFGLPAAVWAHLSLSVELERRVQRCGSCSVCNSKAKKEARLARENKFRRDNRCLRGHGHMKNGRCKECGWS